MVCMRPSDADEVCQIVQFWSPTLVSSVLATQDAVWAEKMRVAISVFDPDAVGLMTPGPGSDSDLDDIDADMLDDDSESENSDSDM